jgi:hypothetical protein
VPRDLLVHLRRAHDHIDRHYAAPLDLAGLAAVAGVSKYHFARCFEAAYGETPIRYLTRPASGCYLFMKGLPDPRGTTGPIEQSGRSRPGGPAPTVPA